LAACTQGGIGGGGQSRPPASTPEPGTTTPIPKEVTPSPEFVGIWEVVTPPGQTEFITIGPQGNAIRSTQGRSDTNGKWSNQDSTIVIVWEDNSTDILTPDQGFLDRSSYSPGSDLTKQPTARSKLARVSKRPATQGKATSWAEGILKHHCARD
jgi:hypothetical protein